METKNAKSISQFQLGDVISKSERSTLYRSLDTHTGRVVAVKQIKKDIYLSQQFAKREFELLQTLSHPNLVSLFGYKELNDYIYLIFEFVEGGSLLEATKKFGPLSEQLLTIYTLQILKGLEFLHLNQIVHRDVRGANVMLTKQGSCKLIEFGCCANAIANRRFSLLVAPCWSAPEIISGEPAGTPADIWALGCTIIELYTGKPPFDDISSLELIQKKMISESHPLIPSNCSNDLTTFLISYCFARPAHLRPSATTCLGAAWLRHSLLAEFNNSGLKRPNKPNRPAPKRNNQINKQNIDTTVNDSLKIQNFMSMPELNKYVGDGNIIDKNINKNNSTINLNDIKKPSKFQLVDSPKSSSVRTTTSTTIENFDTKKTTSNWLGKQRNKSIKTDNSNDEITRKTRIGSFTNEKEESLLLENNLKSALTHLETKRRELQSQLSLVSCFAKTLTPKLISSQFMTEEIKNLLDFLTQFE
eukprot:TRINITY_DN284_c0_g3_i1.p1 TRINITY_DN284_c0_g3~~TRINITY_DN284_c0_g3_i1.p1  ORF type:complete len:474 (-),score=186.14 TRINITY_DN284_c0_g3_i1:27-1448(-)